MKRRTRGRGRPRKNPKVSMAELERLRAKHGDSHRAVKAYMTKHGCTRNAAMEAVAGDPDKARALRRQLKALFQWDDMADAPGTSYDLPEISLPAVRLPRS